MCKKILSSTLSIANTLRRNVLDVLSYFQWFGYYKPGQDKLLYTMFESPLYQNVSSSSVILIVDQMAKF